jgi:hypothetical protein
MLVCSECGREFKNSQSHNAHRAHCPIDKLKGKTWTKSKPQLYVGSGFCAYGCGGIARFQFKNQLLCCVDNLANCPALLKDRNLWMKDAEKQKTMRETHDVGFQNPRIRARGKQTCLERYGFENPFSVKIVQDAIHQSMVEKYGMDHPSKVPEILAKTQATWLSRFGGHPLKTKAVQAKSVATFIENYGVRHPMQNHEIARKVMSTAAKNQHKKFRLPSGRVLVLAGYESGVLEQLLQQGFREEDFDFEMTSLLPIFYTDVDGTERRYYPDFYVPRLNWIFEVKSEYIFQLEKAQNLAKYYRCKELGHRMNFILRDRHPRLVLLQELPTHCEAKKSDFLALSA